jgi:hypothetical protein
LRDNAPLMKLFEDFGETIFAIVVSSATACVVFVATYFAVIWLGTALFRGEASYGFGLALAFPTAVVLGVVAFVLLFRKMRSL